VARPALLLAFECVDVRGQRPCHRPANRCGRIFLARTCQDHWSADCQTTSWSTECKQ